MSTLFGTEQERARWAWEKVGDMERRGKGNKASGRYATLVAKLPSYLQVNGVGQTLAFLYAKGKGEGGKGTSPSGEAKGDAWLLLHLRDRVIRTIDSTGDRRDIMDVVVNMSPEQYRMVSMELTASAIWLKRFAEGRLEAEEDGE